MENNLAKNKNSIANSNKTQIVVDPYRNNNERGNDKSQTILNSDASQSMGTGGHETNVQNSRNVNNSSQQEIIDQFVDHAIINPNP